jgi:outer membrane protein assembly factor BamB
MPLTLDEQRVYIGNTTGQVYAFDISTGGLVWSSKQSGSMSTPTISNGRLFAGFSESGTTNIVCLDSSNGNKLWSSTIDADSNLPLAISDDVVVASTRVGLVAIDAKDGAILNNFSFYEGKKSSPTIADGKIYVKVFDLSVFCIDLKLLQVDWRCFTISGQWSHTPDLDLAPIVNNGVVYSIFRKFHGMTNYGVLCAIDAKTGTLLWTRVLDSSDRPLIVDGKVYFLAGGNLTAMDLKT